jgi:hypothetical protein
MKVRCTVCASAYWRWEVEADEGSYGSCKHRVIDEPAWLPLAWGLEHPYQCGRNGQPRCKWKWKKEPNLSCRAANSMSNHSDVGKLGKPNEVAN